MTTTGLHPTPGARIVLREQIRAVGCALRAAAAVATALLVLATLLTTIALLRGGGNIDFAPELSMLPGMLGFLFPIRVWLGDERFGSSFLWTLPVDRRRHALAKVFAGWVWLMAAVALLVFWMLGLALLSGGNILADETLRVLPSALTARPGTVDPAALQAVRWSPQPVLWLVPFTAATGAYVIASAITLGVRKPLWWLAAIVLGILLVNAVGVAAGANQVAVAPWRLLESLHIGPYGLDALLTARTESLSTEVLLSTGETVGVWRGLPDVGEWMLATLLWTSGALLALWAAASRHRESRRA
jgi:hypothetical protein